MFESQNQLVYGFHQLIEKNVRTDIPVRKPISECANKITSTPDQPVVCFWRNFVLSSICGTTCYEIRKRRIVSSF